MKFLVLALCVCAASAATYDYKPYRNAQPSQNYRQQEAAPFAAAKATYNTAKFAAAAPVTAAKATYNTAKFAGAAPVTAAKATYNTAKFAGAAPVTAAKATYNTAKFASAAPVTAAKATYNTAKFAAAAPVTAAKATYNTAKFAAAAPVTAAKATYNKFGAASSFVEATPAVADSVVIGAKAVYNAPQTYTGSQASASVPVDAAKTSYNTVRVVNAGKDAEAEIVSLNSEVTAEGYKYGFEASNGIAAQSSGVLKTVEGANVVVSQGSYQYIDADGTPVKVEYVADENGYQPRSNILPVAPPVPEAIARAVEYILAHPPKPENYQ